MKSMIITIGRQFGSGGRDIGKRVAEEFGIPFYDKELVEIAAKNTNLNEEAIKDVDERATSSFLYSLAAGNFSLRGMNAPLYYEMPINDKLFIAQSEVIKDIASKGACVIVGRCADYVLEDTPFKCVNIFVYAPVAFRTKRVMEALALPENKARERVLKTEKQRRTYYNYYTSREWGKMENYDLCINTGAVGIDGAVELVKDFVNIRQAQL